MIQKKKRIFTGSDPSQFGVNEATEPQNTQYIPDYSPLLRQQNAILMANVSMKRLKGLLLKAASV